MAFNGSGTYVLPGAALADGQTISATEHNTLRNDMATALTTCVTRDGQSPATANLPMGGFKHTGLGSGTARTESVNLGQVQDGKLNWVDGGGTADAITATYSPAISELVDGQICYVRATAANTTTTPTFSPSGLTARTIVQYGGSALVAGSISGDGHELILRYDLANTRWELLNPRPTNLPQVNDFRLSLTTAVPVTTSDVTGATTIYCVPYKGNRIALYNGSAWVTRTSSEFSLALGTLTANRPYDIFCYDNAGTPTLEFLVWTNDTTRGTALAYQDGVLVKTGATTRRYIGTFYTTSTTTTEDSAANRYLWNYYHRVPRICSVIEATLNWNYTIATFRQANNAAGNKLNYVCGVAEDEVSAYVSACASNSTGGAGSWATSGIGVDSTSVNSAISARSAISVNTCYAQSIAHYSGIPGVGRHYLAWLEFAAATGVQTWYGTAGEIISGIHGRVMA